MPLILFPDKHDDSLVDDDTFSRPRKCFWAIGALQNFKNSLLDTVDGWETLKTSYVDPFIGSKELAESDTADEDGTATDRWTPEESIKEIEFRKNQILRY